MTNTAQPQTFLDLYTSLLNSVREQTSQVATIIQAKRYINTALMDIHIGFGERFPWAEHRHAQYCERRDRCCGHRNRMVQLKFFRDS
jgi:hypothetical protein